MSDVRIAALRHTDAGAICPPRNTSVDLSRGVAEVFSFREPKDVRGGSIGAGMKFSGCLEFLYPGLDQAKDKILGLCPAGSTDAWCQRKVIMVLGDGDPGAAPQRYYKAAYPNDIFPKQLLENITNAGIVVNAGCVGVGCATPVKQCDGFPDPRVYEDPAFPCTGGQTNVTSRAEDILVGIASLTKGKYYGVLK